MHGDPVVTVQHSRFWLILFLGALIGVTVLSVVPSPPVNGLESDKLNHVIAYATLGLLITLTRPRHLLVSLAAVLVYGIILEVIQHFIGRQLDVRDMIANTLGLGVGSGLGFLSVWSFRQARHRLRKNSDSRE